MAKTQRRFPTSIAAKMLTLQAASLILVASILGGLGFLGMDRMSQSMGSIYNDRVVPLQQLKQVADAYAVKIVDTTHKLRAGTLDWDQAGASIRDAETEIDLQWSAYLSTYITPEEGEIVAEVK